VAGGGEGRGAGWPFPHRAPAGRTVVGPAHRRLVGASSRSHRSARHPSRLPVAGRGPSHPRGPPRRWRPDPKRPPDAHHLQRRTRIAPRDGGGGGRPGVHARRDHGPFEGAADRARHGRGDPSPAGRRHRDVERGARTDRRGRPGPPLDRDEPVAHGRGRHGPGGPVVARPRPGRVPLEAAGDRRRD